MGSSRPVRVLTADDVRRALDVNAAILAQAEAFRQLTAGTASIPPRTVVDAPGGATLFMPGLAEASGALGLKVVSVVPGNPARGIASVLGAVLLFDPLTGEPVAMMDGTVLTVLRTAAGSALATDLLASPDAAVLTVFGAGPQAREHVRAIRAVRPIAEVRIVSRTRARAESMAAAVDGVPATVFEDRTAAVRGAHIIVTATNSRAPVFDGRTVGAGTHVNAIGAYTPETREVDEHVVLRARLVVDHRESALEEAGDLLIPIAEGKISVDSIDVEIGQILEGSAPGGRVGHELTFYKSVGNAAQDLVTARRVLEVAEERDLGTTVDL